jgi:hypothetical protein
MNSTRKMHNMDNKLVPDTSALALLYYPGLVFVSMFYFLQLSGYIGLLFASHKWSNQLTKRAGLHDS